MSKLHINTEYLKGFTEGLLAEYEVGIGPFKNHLDGYKIEILIINGWAKCLIHYSVNNSNTQSQIEFKVTENTNSEMLRFLVEDAVNEILKTIKQFYKEV